MPYANVDSLKIHYEITGSGPSLVLLHGIGGNIRLWRYQIDALSDEFTVVAWDAPGYGRSDDPEGEWRMADYADHLAGLFDHLGYDRAHVLGQSWGGAVAQEFYRRHPNRVQSLILADTSPGGGSLPPEEREQRLRARLDPLETLTPAEMARRRAPVLLAPDAPPEMLSEVESVLAEIHPAGYRMAAIASTNADLRDVLPTIKVPTLVLAAELDQVVPPDTAEAMHRVIPGSRLVVIAGAGHLSCIDHLDAFNVTVRDFLRSLPTESRNE